MFALLETKKTKAPSETTKESARKDALVEETKQSPSTEISSLPPAGPAHALGKMDYAKIAKKLFNNKTQLQKKLSPIFDFFSLVSSRITRLNTQFKQESSPLYPQIKLQAGQNKIEHFLNHFSKIMADLDSLFNPVDDKMDVSKATDNLIAEISNLSDEFELLNLETILNQYIPPNFDELKKKMVAKVVGSMKTWLLSIEKEASLSYATIWQTVTEENFKKLPRVAQYNLLIAMETVLTFYKEFILMLDKIELQFGFREDSLLTLLMHPEVEIKSEEQDLHEKTTTEYTKILLQQFQRLSSQYQALIKLSNYTPIETAPYRHSKNQARMHLKEKIILSLQDKQQQYAALEKDISAVVLFIAQTRSPSFVITNYPPISLPPAINTATEATEIQQKLLKNYQVLKEILYSKSSKKLSQESKDAILAPHQAALSLISELEFYLLEKGRIETICQTPEAADTIAPHRDFEVTETLKMVMEKSSKMITISQAFLQKDTKQRKSLEESLELRQKKVRVMKNNIEDLFDPIFVKHANDQFLREEAAQKAPSNQAEEKKEDFAMSPASAVAEDEEKRKRLKPQINNPFSYFAYKLLISSMRFLNSMDTLLYFFDPNTFNTPSETSPSAALTADMEKSMQIFAHLNKLWADYNEFEIWMEGLSSKDSYDKNEPEAKEIGPKVEANSVLSTMKASLEQKIKEALKPLELYLSDLKNLAQTLLRPSAAPHESKGQVQIGRVSIDVHNEIGQLIQALSQDIKEISSAFIANYDNYLMPPTQWTHMKTVALHVRLLFRLRKNIDHLFDLISENQIPAQLQLLYHIGQVFKKIFVMIDAFEIHLHLKEGTILKGIQAFLNDNDIDVNAYLAKIKAHLDKHALQFAEEDYFPYTAAIAENRRQMLSAESDEVTRAIIEDRITKMEPKAPEEKPALPEVKNFWSKRFNPSGQEKLQDPLIFKLIEKEKEHKEADDFMDDIDELAEEDRRAYLLFEGKMGAILNPLCTKTSILTELERQIDRLKETRHHWLWSRNSLEKRITLLQEFRYFLHKEGHSLKDAAEQLGAACWETLLKTDRALFIRLDAMENKIPADQRKKKIIELPKKHPITEDNVIIKTIDSRLAELQEKFYKSSTNHKKQDLLIALKRNMLERNLSFNKALQQVKKDALKDCHLLHEGMTGKMIDGIEKSLAKPKHKKERINREIQTLREKYFEKAGFFSKKSSKVRQIAQDIHLLKNIRDDLLVAPDEKQKVRLKYIALDLRTPYSA